MSKAMDHGIIGMPFDIAMSSSLSRRQFYIRAQAILAERDALEAGRDAKAQAEREAVKQAIAEALGDAYDCIRVWSAWSYGTMGPDDFQLVADDDDRLDEITEAAIGAMAALSQQAEPNESELEALGLGYPFSKEDAVKLWYKGFRTEPIALLEVWEAIGHDVGIDPSKHELMDSLRNMEAICRSHGYDFPCPAEPAPAQDEREMTAGRAANLMRRFKSEEKMLGPNEQAAIDYVLELLATRPAQTEQQPATVKHSLTVEPVAYAVFADNGNVVCFSTQRDHPSLTNLESEGKAVVSLYPLAHPNHAELEAALDHIGGLSRALRVGGPDPMDLEGLSDALNEAVDTAHEIRNQPIKAAE